MQHKQLPFEWVERIFQRLDGRFGSEFTNKFKLGELDSKGRDIGIENAKHVWVDELGSLSAERISQGLRQNFQRAPSCDEFKRACSPVIASHQDFQALPKPKPTDQQRKANIQKLDEVRKQLGKRFASNEH